MPRRNPKKQGGDIYRIYAAECCVCHKTQTLDAESVKDAKAELRRDFDWSLGRDKLWRCDECRPLRFGERI